MNIEAVVTCYCDANVCHGKGGQLNNSTGNLRYDTQLANIHDKWLSGTMANGERNGRAKLTGDQVIAIRASQKPQKHLAEQYGVSPKAIRLILDGTNWSHLLPEK